MTFEKIPELLTRGHHVNEKRLGLLEERSEYSQYLILPTKYSFPKVVRIMSIVVGFISKVSKGRKMKGHLLAEGKLRFTVFQADVNSSLSGEDSYDLQPVVGVVTEQHDAAQETDIVTYFGEDSKSADQKQMYYSVQVVRKKIVA